MLIKIINAILPARCFICRQPAEAVLALCAACHDKLPYNHTACRQCARPLAGEDMLCGQCQRHPPCYDQIISPLQYKHQARQLILELKFQGKLRNAALLARLFYEQLPGNRQPEALIPVPLHSKRLRERGYNQSLELAKRLGKLTGLPVDIQSTRRHRYTKRQADLSLRDKKSNVKNAFEMTGRPAANHIAIVDDVMTSGHTVNEFAQLLKKSGIKRVDVWVMTRAG